MPAPAHTSYSTPAVSTAAPPVIEIENVVKTFNGRNVLDGVSLTVRRGETLVIMGASGCGKSTLLRCLIGAHKPDGGSIKLFDQNIWKLRAKQLDAVRKRFGILFQSGALFSSMTVGDNVALPLKEHTDLGADMIELMVKVKLELVGLREAEDRLPSEISGGMAKRAGLARAIALDPELLFYDEPTSGLDPIMTGIIDSLIIDLARTMNVTSVVVTHDLKSAFRVADRMVVLNNGRIVQQGLPHEIRSSTDPFVKRFIHGPVESRTAMIPRPGGGIGPGPGAHLVSSARIPIPGLVPQKARETVTDLREALEHSTDPVEALPTKTQDPVSAQRIEALERAAAHTGTQALEPVAPDEAVDELARELRLSHPSPFVPEVAEENPLDTTGKFEMGTMLIPGMGGSTLEPAAPPEALVKAPVKTPDPDLDATPSVEAAAVHAPLSERTA